MPLSGIFIVFRTAAICAAVNFVPALDREDLLVGLEVIEEVFKDFFFEAMRVLLP